MRGELWIVNFELWILNWGKRLKGKAYYYATKDIEVLIDGEIPKEAYTIVDKHH